MLEAASGKSGAAFSCRRQRGCCCPFCNLLTFFMYEKYKKIKNCVEKYLRFVICFVAYPLSLQKT